MSFSCCETCGCDTSKARTWTVCRDCRRRAAVYPYVFAVVMLAREVVRRAPSETLTLGLRGAIQGLRSAVELVDTVQEATGREPGPFDSSDPLRASWPCDHVNPIDLLRQGCQWCPKCGAMRGAVRVGSMVVAPQATEWGEWLKPNITGGGAASILESLGHNSTAAAEPTRSVVEKPNSAEQFSADAPSSASAPPAKGVRVSHLEDSSQNGKTWALVQAAAVVDAWDPMPSVGYMASHMTGDVAAALQAAYAKGWEEARTKYEGAGVRAIAEAREAQAFAERRANLVRDPSEEAQRELTSLRGEVTSLRKQLQEAQAACLREGALVGEARRERDEARAIANDLRKLAPDVDELRALKTQRDERDELRRELDTTKALLRRAVGVINDVDKARDEASAVLDAFAELDESEPS